MKKIIITLLCLSMSVAIAGYSSGGRGGGYSSGGTRVYSSGSSYRGSHSYASNYSSGGRSGYVASTPHSYVRSNYSNSSYGSNSYVSPPHTTVINNTTHGGGGGFGGGGFWSGMLGGYVGASIAQPHYMGGGMPMAPMYGQPGYVGNGGMGLSQPMIGEQMIAQPYGYAYSPLSIILIFLFIIFFIAIFLWYLMNNHHNCH